jgi:tryptophan-rich sensory protein
MISLLVFAALVAGAAVSGAQFQPGDWYAVLAKPSWTPPSWLFGPVWTLLYIGIAVAGWLVWRKTGRVDAALTVWFAQMVLNAAWSWLFFGLHRPDLALVDIVAMIVLIVAFIVLARGSSAVASWLFVPYLLWVSYATALNAAIWRMNPAAS